MVDAEGLTPLLMVLNEPGTAKGSEGAARPGHGAAEAAG
jgi:hypothetical protein